MKDLNTLRKLAGIPLQESIILNESADDIPKIAAALIKAGATNRGGIEWVDMNDDDEDVKGPDGKQGWFNDSRLAHAVEGFDSTTVRDVVAFFWFLERIQDGRLNSTDTETLKKIVPLIK